MYSQSFHNGRRSSLPLDDQFHSVVPYDATFGYNRIIERVEGDPTSSVRSLDLNMMLKAIKSEDSLALIYKLTLGGKAVRGGVGVWDVLFNDARKSVTGCVLGATSSFGVIPQERVVRSQSFLNYDMSVSRIHFNQIRKGDRLGVAINDIMSGIIYVLFYQVDDLCSVLSQTRDKDDRSWLIPSLNLRMEYALRIDYNAQDDNATFFDMEEGNAYPEVLADPLMQRLVSNAYDIKKAYPWKPHFLPTTPSSWSRAKLEKRLAHVQNQNLVTPISYRDFELRCSEIYDTVGQRRKNAPRSTPPVEVKPNEKGRRGNKPNRSGPFITPPLIEVVSLADRFQVKFSVQENPSETSYVFTKDEVLAAGGIERYLLGKDLDGLLLSEVPDILVLNAETFGPGAYVRYLSINF